MKLSIWTMTVSIRFTRIKICIIKCLEDSFINEGVNGNKWGKQYKPQSNRFQLNLRMASSAAERANLGHGEHKDISVGLWGSPQAQWTC